MSAAAFERADEPARLTALRQRLQAVASALSLDDVPPEEAPATAVSRLYGALVAHVHADPGTETLWLLMTAMAGAMPDAEELTEAVRARDLSGPGEFAVRLLDAAYELSASRGSPELELDVVSGTAVVDVHFSAQYNLHTGIQRVVRETLPRWHAEHDLTLVAWTEPGGAMRRLTPPESDRVLRWHEHGSSATEETVEEPPRRMVVPWRCSVLLPENPPSEHGPALAAISRYSGNTVGSVGYDLIPVISSDLIHAGLADRFTRYLEVVKFADRVAGISASATLEFQGFVNMLGPQGLPGPAVVECPLPVEVPAGDPVPPTTPPLVVSIGSFEPRKNQLAVLHAAEQLWREGLEFSLELIGGGGYATELDPLIVRLTRAGRPIRRRTAISDDELWHLVRAARFSVFLSLHEGFGLPVAESLACGTPCLTSNHGATLEIADGGGALVVDPQDDCAVAEQMRRLLTDDTLLQDLRDEAARRPARTWDDYARELWQALVPAADNVGAGTR